MAIPAGAPGWRSTLDATCTHGSSAAARETLLTSGAEFGEVKSPAQSERAERGGALKKTAHLHHVEGGKHSAEFLDSSHPLGVTPRGSAHLVDLILMAEPPLGARTAWRQEGEKSRGAGRQGQGDDCGDDGARL